MFNQLQSHVPTLYRKLKIVLIPIFRVLVLVFFWVLCCTIILWFMLDQNTPGNLISWRLAFPVVISLILVTLLFLLYRKHSSKHVQKTNEPRPKRHFVRPSKRALALFISFTAIVIVAIVGYWQYTEAEKRDLLKTASVHFSVASHPAVSQGQENSTVIELERAYRYLSDLVPAFNLSHPIQVYIYPNGSELQRQTGRSGNITGFTWCSINGPVIYIQTERETSIADDSKTTTPTHEMVHAAVCALISDEFVDIPKWFHEGLAEYESNRGYSRMLERNSIRLFVLWNHDEIMEYPALISYDPSASDEHDKIFYSSSFEFMRYIISKSDCLAPWDIINAVGKGQVFEYAFQSIVGDTPSSMYQKWIDYFYGILD